MKTALLLFIICTFANVVLSTIKSVMTIKGGKVSAAIWNALAFGLYSYIVVLTATAPISTLGKVLVTVGCNLVGVYGVKLLEEKLRKDRLWKVEMTVRQENALKMHNDLTAANIPNNYHYAGKHAIFSCYCATKNDTENAVTIGASYGAKYFASETTFGP